jgi:hypothetical protein
LLLQQQRRESAASQQQQQPPQQRTQLLPHDTSGLGSLAVMAAGASHLTSNNAAAAAAAVLPGRKVVGATDLHQNDEADDDDDDVDDDDDDDDSTETAPDDEGDKKQASRKADNAELSARNASAITESEDEKEGEDNHDVRDDTQNETFPFKLYRMLKQAEEDGQDDIVSFFPHGAAFAIHKPQEFVSEIMPKYFTTSRMSSFQRQLNLYGFRRVADGEF